MPIPKVGRNPTPAHLVDSRKTALIIVDMQNDFCMPGGTCANIGDDLTPMADVLRNVSRLRDAARDANVLTIFVQSNYDPVVRSAPGADQAARRGYTKGICISGTPGMDFCEGAGPVGAPNEIVVRKHRYSAFWGSEIDLVLRANGIATVVLAGVTSECCVESTARDAFFRDYFVVTVADCTTAFSLERHEAALRVLAHLFGPVMTAEAVIGYWRSQSDRRAVFEGGLEARAAAVRARASECGETALVLIGFQNDFCAGNGVLAAHGAGITAIQQAVLRTRTLLEAARRAGIPAFHVKLETHPLTLSAGSPVCVVDGACTRLTALANSLNATIRHPCVAGSAGAEFVAALQPLASERVFTARRFSAFADTSLDMLVGANDIEHLLIAGVTAEGAVEATAREALDRDYRITLVEDCVASFDADAAAARAAIDTIARLCGPTLRAEQVGSVLVLGEL